MAADAISVSRGSSSSKVFFKSYKVYKLSFSTITSKVFGAQKWFCAQNKATANTSALII